MNPVPMVPPSQSAGDSALSGELEVIPNVKAKDSVRRSPGPMAQTRPPPPPHARVQLQVQPRAAHVAPSHVKKLSEVHEDGEWE